MTKNKNLARHADCAKKLKAKLAARLPSAICSSLRSAKRKLWWHYPTYRRASPVQKMDAWDRLKQLRTEGVLTTIHGQEIKTSPFITEGEATELHRLVTESRPGFAIEIGFAHGYSTLALLQGLSDKKCGTLLSIDPLQMVGDFSGGGLMNVKKAGLDGFHLFLEKESQFALPALVEAGTKIDFAFIDGNHIFDFTLIEFFYLDRMLETGGTIVFHDYLFPAVRACLNFIEANFPYTVSPTPEKNLRVLTKQSFDERPWYFFMPFSVPQIKWTTVENREFCE